MELGLLTQTPACSDDPAQAMPSIMGRPLICQSAISSACVKPGVDSLPPSICFCALFLFAKARAHVSHHLSCAAERQKEWKHLPHCTMFLYLTLTCCQVLLTLLGFELKNNNKTTWRHNSATYMIWNSGFNKKEKTRIINQL